MEFWEQSFCFVCAHFAAGQSNIEDRNRDFMSIVQNLHFNGRKLNHHESFLVTNIEHDLIASLVSVCFLVTLTIG